MTLDELLADIHALEEELLAFERKYCVCCGDFLCRHFRAAKSPRTIRGSWISASGPAFITLIWRGRLTIGTRFSVGSG